MWGLHENQLSERTATRLRNAAERDVARSELFDEGVRLVTIEELRNAAREPGNVARNRQVDKTG